MILEGHNRMPRTCANNTYCEIPQALSTHLFFAVPIIIHITCAYYVGLVKGNRWAAGVHCKIKEWRNALPAKSIFEANIFTNTRSSWQNIRNPT